jgi:lipoprotein NlpI
MKTMKTALFPLLGLFLAFAVFSCGSDARKEKKLMDMFNLGGEYYDKEEYQKAYDCLTLCIEMDSTYVEFYENRSSSL